MLGVHALISVQVLRTGAPMLGLCKIRLKNYMEAPSFTVLIKAEAVFPPSSLRLQIPALSSCQPLGVQTSPEAYLQ